jgi:uncharacterized protein
VTSPFIRANHGVFGSEQTALVEIVLRLRDALDPREIWLFGSRARGDARPDSDFDLLVVAKPGGVFGSDDYDLADRPLRGTGVGCDVVPCSSSDFDDGLDLPTSLVARIVEEGRKIYEADQR